MEVKNVFDELDEIYGEAGQQELTEGPSGQTSAKKAAWIALGGTKAVGKYGYAIGDFEKINEIMDGCATANDPATNFPDWIVIHHLNGDHSDNSAWNRVITAAHWHNLLGIKAPKISDPAEDIVNYILRICKIARTNNMKIYSYDEACRGNVEELVYGGWQREPDDLAGGGYMASDYLKDNLRRAFKLDQDTFDRVEHEITMKKYHADMAKLGYKD